jgi:hypothetical protein
VYEPESQSAARDFSKNEKLPTICLNPSKIQTKEKDNSLRHVAWRADARAAQGEFGTGNSSGIDFSRFANTSPR